jgi:hypothetical protein
MSGDSASLSRAPEGFSADASLCKPFAFQGVAGLAVRDPAHSNFPIGRLYRPISLNLSFCGAIESRLKEK